MSNKTKEKKKGYLRTILNNKCPHCREGNLFLDKGAYHLKSFMKMNEKCPVCGQKTELEDGFYYGTGYVSYALTVAFSVFTFVAWYVLIGVSVDDDRLFWWIGTNIFLLLVCQPLFMRLSRSIWLSFFVKYNTNWKVEKSKLAAV